MKQVVLAGAVALAMAGSYVVTAASAAELPVPAASAPVVSEAKIAQVKAMLRLTPAQEAHWPAVAAALRQVGRSAPESKTGGLVRRATAAITDAASVKRVLAAARPLIKTFDEEQKRDAMQLVQSLGFKVASAF